MKEIDFLPEWYKSGRRRQISYRTQYVALGGLFVVMLVWSLLSARTLSKATAELARTASGQLQTPNVSREFANVKNELEDLQKKVGLIEEMDSKIDVASTLAEISSLIGEKVVLSKVEFVAESFAGTPERKPSGGSVVRVASGGLGAKQSPPLGEVRFKVILNGIASDPSDVAELICRLEESSYFCLVYPLFSRNKTIDALGSSAKHPDIHGTRTPGEIRGNIGLAARKYQVSEFEISCYLANYRQDES
jgi:hypothetical protein